MNENIKKGFSDVPLGKKKTSDGDNAVVNLSIPAVIKKLQGNTGETANFIGRLMNDEKVSLVTVVIDTIDTSFLVEVNPMELHAFIAQYTNRILDEYPDKLHKQWGKVAVSYRVPGLGVGDSINEKHTSPRLEK